MLTPTVSAIKSKDIIHMTRKNRPGIYKTVFAVIWILLTVIILFVFFIGAGRAVAGGESDDLKIRLYEFLEDSPFSFLSNFIFEGSVPSYESSLPPSANSDGTKVSVLFPGTQNADVREITLTKKNDGISGILIALSDPTALSVGSSTQGSNALSEILKVEHARLAFAFSDQSDDPVLINGGEWTYKTNSELYGYFGFDGKGVMHFGTGSYSDIEGLSLTYATKQTVHSLICGGVPCSFDMSKGAIGSASLSVAQCEDGSVLILFADASASCQKITELLYRYSAVNAATVYVGDAVGFANEEKSVSLGSGSESVQHASAWIIE